MCIHRVQKLIMNNLIYPEFILGNTVIDTQIYRKCGAESTFKFDGCIVANLTKHLDGGESFHPDFPGLGPGGLSMVEKGAMVNISGGVQVGVLFRNFKDTYNCIFFVF